MKISVKVFDCISHVHIWKSLQPSENIQNKYSAIIELAQSVSRDDTSEEMQHFRAGTTYYFLNGDSNTPLVITGPVPRLLCMKCM